MVLQNNSRGWIPDEALFGRWVEKALESATMDLVIRLVDEEESQTLNRQFRGRDVPTNVLSFPYEPLMDEDANYLGDIVICVPVVLHEAAAQKKEPVAHFAHMVVHAVLHLQGYDHLSAEEARQMESLEIAILRKLGFADPYTVLE